MQQPQQRQQQQQQQRRSNCFFQIDREGGLHGEEEEEKNTRGHLEFRESTLSFMETYTLHVGTHWKRLVRVIFMF
jgi:hypothetical protein